MSTRHMPIVIVAMKLKIYLSIYLSNNYMVSLRSLHLL